MQRTQIYLPQDLKHQVEQVAAHEGTSMAEVIRRALAEAVKQQHHLEANPLNRLAQLDLRGGPDDLSVRMDDYLYNEDSGRH